MVLFLAFPTQISYVGSLEENPYGNQNLLEKYLLVSTEYEYEDRSAWDYLSLCESWNWSWMVGVCKNSTRRLSLDIQGSLGESKLHGGQKKRQNVHYLPLIDPVLQRKSLLPFLLYRFKSYRAKGDWTQPSGVSLPRAHGDSRSGFPVSLRHSDKRLELCVCVFSRISQAKNLSALQVVSVNSGLYLGLTRQDSMWQWLAIKGSCLW